MLRNVEWSPLTKELKLKNYECCLTVGSAESLMEELEAKKNVSRIRTFWKKWVHGEPFLEIEWVEEY